MYRRVLPRVCFVDPCNIQVAVSRQHDDLKRVTGTFGWPAVPKVIREVCLLQAQRAFNRRDTPFGLIGGPSGRTLIEIPAIDPDLAMLVPDSLRKVGAPGIISWNMANRGYRGGW